MTPPETSPPLSAYQRVVSKDIDVLHDMVEPFAVGHDLQAREPDVPLDGLVNAIGVGAVNLVWVRYGGGGVIVDTPPTGGHFAMCAPIAPMGVEYRSTHSRDTAGGSLVLSHDEAMRMTPHPTLGCLVIATSTGRLTDHLAGHLGRDRSPPLRFHSVDGPAVMPSSIVDRTWRHVCTVLDHATAQEGLHPLAARNLEESLLTAILLGLPHTATGSLAEAPASAPHHLAGTIRDWVEAHHHRPVGVTDIAAAAGIGVRQLQAICQDQWGVTPTQLLRGVRLDHARTAHGHRRRRSRRIRPHEPFRRPLPAALRRDPHPNPQTDRERRLRPTAPASDALAHAQQAREPTRAQGSPTFGAISTSL